MQPIPGQPPADGEASQGQLGVEAGDQEIGVGGPGVEKEAMPADEQVVVAKLCCHTTRPGDNLAISL
jgi:hypothetical protein